MTYIVADRERYPQCLGECGQLTVEPLLIRVKMALQINEQVCAPEYRFEPFSQHFGIFATHQRLREETAVAARQANQALAIAFEFGEAETAFTLRRAQLGSGEHAAEVAVTCP